MTFSRRQFLSSAAGSTALVALSRAVPGFLLHAAEQQAKSSGQQILVVVQLSGGNDGLNTIVPFTDPEYKKNRFALAIPPDAVLKILDEKNVFLRKNPILVGCVVDEGVLKVGTPLCVPDKLVADPYDASAPLRP